MSVATIIRNDHQGDFGDELARMGWCDVVSFIGMVG
jgi:hypothetical protein